MARKWCIARDETLGDLVVLRWRPIASILFSRSPAALFP